MVEVYKRGGSIKACYDFFNELIEYDTLSVQPARFRKKIEFELQTTRGAHKFKR